MKDSKELVDFRENLDNLKHLIEIMLLLHDALVRMVAMQIFKNG
jgi:hypothetical protein